MQVRESGGGSSRAALAAAGAALGLGVALAYSGGEGPLLGYRGAAAFLCLAVYFDLRNRRIPNRLTAPGLALALAGGCWTGGLAGLGVALLGALVAGALFFPPFALRALGAGDVKALMVAGALLGPRAALELALFAIGVAGALAVALLVARGGMRELLVRWHAALLLTISTRRPHYLGPPAGSPAAARFPFAPALLLALALWARLEAA
jgi:prepilin peptidase CpaA